MKNATNMLQKPKPEQTKINTVRIDKTQRARILKRKYLDIIYDST